MGAHHFPLPDPPKTLDHCTDVEIGPRWYELDTKKISIKTGNDVYVLKVLRMAGKRHYFTDGTSRLNSSQKEVVPGAQRFVEITAETSEHVLPDGRRFFKNVMIKHTDSAIFFRGQMTLHTDGHISLTGYNG